MILFTVRPLLEVSCTHKFQTNATFSQGHSYKFSMGAIGPAISQRKMGSTALSEEYLFDLLSIMYSICW